MPCIPLLQQSNLNEQQSLATSNTRNHLLSNWRKIDNGFIKLLYFFDGYICLAPLSKVRGEAFKELIRYVNYVIHGLGGLTLHVPSETSVRTALFDEEHQDVHSV